MIKPIKPKQLFITKQGSGNFWRFGLLFKKKKKTKIYMQVLKFS